MFFVRPPTVCCFVALLLSLSFKVAHLQLISFGSGNLFYQVNFHEWVNPDGKTYTGANCDTVGGRCDTKFTGYIQAITRDDPRRSPAELSWPGPKQISKWQTIGKLKYEENSLQNFANMTLDGVQPDGFREGILRVQVLDVDNLRNDVIGDFVGLLPGLDQLRVGYSHTDAEWSRPVALHALSTVLPGVQDEQADREQVRKQRLVVRARAWGATPRASPMARRFPSPPSTSAATANGNGNNDNSAQYYRQQQQQQQIQQQQRRY